MNFGCKLNQPIDLINATLAKTRVLARNYFILHFTFLLKHQIPTHTLGLRMLVEKRDAGVFHNNLVVLEVYGRIDTDHTF
jgi:hypothetical protein